MNFINQSLKLNPDSHNAGFCPSPDVHDVLVGDEVTSDEDREGGLVMAGGHGPNRIEYVLQSPVYPQNKNTRLINVLRKEGKPTRRKTISDVNLSYMREVLFNKRLFDEVQQSWLRSVFHEIRRNQPGYAEGLLPNLGMLLFAHPSFLERLCRCGQNYSRCKMRMWCPRCAYADATNLWKTYLRNYDRGSFWFVTVAIRGDVPFDYLHSLNLRSFWKFLPACLTLVRKSGLYGIKGMLVSNEVSVRQFLPLLICPHLHAVVDADDLGEDFVNDLEAFINYRLAQLASGSLWNASVHVKRIESKSALKSCLRYLIKAISIHNQYKDAWLGQVQTGFSDGWEINNEVRDLINGISHVSSKPVSIHNIRTSGTMNAKSAAFLGIPTARRNDNWEEIKCVSLTDEDWGKL